MERFTFFTDDYPAVTCDSCYEDQNENYTGPAIDRLAEYEATGLMPAEVATLIQELKYAKQQCREERRWIPVTERMPEIGQKCLIANRESVVRGWLRPDGVWKTGVSSDELWSKFSLYPPTHWMPLPEPPKGE